MKKFIVKIQTRSNQPVEQFLLYDKERTVERLGDLTPRIKELMGSDKKRFFYANWSGAGEITILGQAPWQDW